MSSDIEFKGTVPKFPPFRVALKAGRVADYNELVFGA